MLAGVTDSLQDQVALAEAVRQATLGVPGVVGISPGRGYIEATYGRNVEVLGVGISRQSGRVSANVHLIVAQRPVLAIAKRVRTAVHETIRHYAELPVGPINIYIDDMEIASFLPEPTV